MTAKAVRSRAVILVLIVFLSAGLNAQSNDWILASAPFIILTNPSQLDSQTQKIAQSLTSDIPQLILSSITNSMQRSILSDEIYNRELYALQKDMTSLITSYTNAIKVRDQIVFSTENLREFKSKIEVQEKKIKDIEIKIEDNFDLQKAVKEKSLSSQRVKEDLNTTQEKIILYKNSPTELFKYDTTKILSDNDLENLALREKINGLITGSIQVFDDFMQVSASLDVFPKKKESEPIIITTHISEPEYAATAIANALYNKITNSIPATLVFNINPSKAAEGTSIFVSDQYLKGDGKEVNLLSGIYSIRIQAPGYKPITFNYSIEAAANYVFTVTMKKEILYPITLENPFETQGSVSLNALSYGDFPASVVVNGQQYLGQFSSKAGWSNFFVYNSEFANEYEQIQLSYSNTDISAAIEKSRKRLYISYAAVIFALPAYYFTDSMYKNIEQAQNSAIPVNGSLEGWKRASQISLGGVIALGINMGVQLGLYLKDANSVLPKEQNTSKEKGK